MCPQCYAAVERAEADRLAWRWLQLWDAQNDTPRRPQRRPQLRLVPGCGGEAA